MPADFAREAWNDPQSFWMTTVYAVSATAIQGYVWKLQQQTYRVWRHEITTIERLRTEASLNFDLVEADNKTTNTSVDALLRDFALAETRLAKALAALSREDIDQWLQNDTIGKELRSEVQKLRPASEADAGVVDAAENARELIEAESKHAKAYGRLQSAIMQRRLPELAEAATRRRIQAPKPLEILVREAGMSVRNLPTGSGSPLEIYVTPGMRRGEIRGFSESVDSMEAAVRRSLEWPRWRPSLRIPFWRTFELPKGWGVVHPRLRGMILPAVLLATPVVTVLISRYHDKLNIETQRMDTLNQAKREALRQINIKTLDDLVKKPMLSMVVDAWKSHSVLRFHPCPFSKPEHDEILEPDVDRIGGLALMTILEMQKKRIALEIGKGDVTELSDEFFRLFFRRVLEEARSKAGPGLLSIPINQWNGPVLEELADVGKRVYGAGAIHAQDAFIFPPAPDPDKGL
jgi:hypothetical protein